MWDEKPARISLRNGCVLRDIYLTSYSSTHVIPVKRDICRIKGKAFLTIQAIGISSE
jgi:hypothetical protein